MTPATDRYERVRFLDEAANDVRSLVKTNVAVAREVLRLLRELDRGNLKPIPLQDFAKTGDLSDCGKLVVALEGEPEYRVVIRDLADGFEVSEVVAVEDRTPDLPYLLAGLRLARLDDDPVRRSDARRRIDRIRKLLGRE